MSFTLPAQAQLELPPGVAAVTRIQDTLTGKYELWWRVKADDTIHRMELPDDLPQDELRAFVYTALRMTC